MGFGDAFGDVGTEGRGALGLADAERRGVAPEPAAGVAVRGEVDRAEGLAEAPAVGDWSGERVGGGCQDGLAVGSTNGKTVSGRAGPPAKLTPTSSV
ncbi:hypothetical protein [Micromonospora sp. CB01531]|uniref:hypothetical protein n=1 Tax=Micromonospora sp. CB01531 TaxID=1718947 RepID=UPI00093ABAA8|nr:hypothetical protein [Micromonospora sp. CB01531]OKI49099.1 hypothetical protein A6A27_35615 [Micromonospora sp. CB01531]